MDFSWGSGAGMANTGNVPIFSVFILVLCEYHCTVCTVRVPLVQWFSMGSTGSVPIFPVFVLVLCVYHCTVCTVLVCFLPIHSGHQVRWTYQPGSHRRKVTQEECHTRFFIHLPSAVRAFLSLEGFNDWGGRRYDDFVPG